MRSEVFDDAEELRRRAADLLADEARHNLILGILGTLIEYPEVYPEYRLFLVSDEHGPQSAAVITSPYNLIVSDTRNTDALSVLVRAAIEDDIDVPGAIGNQPTIDRFVGEWRRITGTQANLKMEQGVFALSQVSDVERCPGRGRRAVPADQLLIERLASAFVAEAMPDEPHDEERMRSAIQRHLSGEGPGGHWLWEDDGEVVSWSGHGNPTGRGIRIGPVYTPPELRGRGYATALVASQSQWLLDGGYDFCFLYTDLANPTSNAIYERIGYRKIAESAVYGFVAPPSPAT
ncbi:MAG: GNAT family N-acetyltransferase [bacterium]|nr:GNAT family N-acetyltransferase [bacterium]